MPERLIGAIVITGASSGLGAALAQAYAAPGVALALVGRDSARLSAIADACRAKGAEVEAEVMDVGEAEPLGAWLASFDRRHPVDLIIANAGTSSGPGPDEAGEGVELAARQVRTNLLGVIHTIEPLLPAMVARGTGAVGIVASAAAYRGLPYSPAYSASKAGARLYGEALRARLAPAGVAVSVICPGFFVSPMTDRFQGSHPFLLSTAAAAATVKRGLDRGARRIDFPGLLILGMRLADLMPPLFGDMIVRAFRFRIVSG